MQLAFKGNNGLFKIKEHGPRRELREGGKLKIRLRTGKFPRTCRRTPPNTAAKTVGKGKSSTVAIPRKN
ncbi:hypothetical protein [Hymenobacter frigidus]|uniref:hypothetical protein n=1 Tax=Hymenobacter frigidus TaxID=1524095 RepID=UPI001662E0F6|nr:hypothetical protein [Hymenobacter frigidus]